MYPLQMFKETQALIEVFEQEALQSPGISELWTNTMVMSSFGSVVLLYQVLETYCSFDSCKMGLRNLGPLSKLQNPN